MFVQFRGGTEQAARAGSTLVRRYPYSPWGLCHCLHRSTMYRRLVPRPWTTIEAVATPDGLLELHQRGEREFMIRHAGRVLMTSAYHRSEVAVAELGCAAISTRPQPAVLIGGAGLGYTLRAVLDALPSTAQVTVAELNPVIVRWCEGPLAVLTDNAIGDPRTTPFVGDVMAQVRESKRARRSWDAIIIDLYIGPGNEASGQRHPLYGDTAIADVFAALAPGGVYAVWGEEPSSRFESRLKRAGFQVRTERTRGAGPHHVIFLATRPPA